MRVCMYVIHKVIMEFFFFILPAFTSTDYKYGMGYRISQLNFVILFITVGISAFNQGNK